MLHLPQDVLEKTLRPLPPLLKRWVHSSRAAQQTMRDASMIWQGFFGQKPPLAMLWDETPLTTGSPAALAREPGLAPLPGELLLRVLERREETPSATSFLLERPTGFAFEPGQFLTFTLSIEGREYRRSYSLSSSPEDPTAPLVVTVKRVQGGVVSRWLHEQVRVGDRLRTRGPSGNFVYTHSLGLRRLVLLGGGSGMTPLMSILRVALAREGGPEVTLVFANRSREEILFAEELAALQRKHPERFTVVHVLEQPGDFPCEHGRVTRALLARHGKPGEHSRVYLCGPQPMMDAARADLLSLGWSSEELQEERFVSLREFSTGASERASHRLRVGERLVVLAAGKSVLEGAVAAGLELPFSCTMGGCGACKTRLLEGEVALEEPNCLTAEERAAGMILTCVAHAHTDLTLQRLADSNPRGDA